MARYDALIVGAGPSGLVSLKHLREARLQALAIEKRHDVGGVWLLEEGEGHSSAYHTLVTITSKACSRLSDHDFPKDWPDYLPWYLVQRYFRSYAEKFGLLEHIHFGEEVRLAQKVGEEWRVETTSGKVYMSRYLIAASGHHWKPFLPSYPGSFTGESYHSHAYKSPAQLQGKRILIVGAGNSGADIAVDAARVAASVEISLRRGYHIMPKFGWLGEPSDLLYKKLVAPLPRFLREPVAMATLYLLRGSMRRYGMPQPQGSLFYTHPLVNSELLYQLRHGKVRIRPSIQRLEGNFVFFSDGTRGEYDTLIWATGYEVAFPYLDPSLVPTGDKVRRLYLNIFYLDEPTLLYIGLIQPNGCLWNLAEKQAMLAARYIAGSYRLPPFASQEAHAYWQKHAKRYANSPRHLWEVDWYEYAAQLDRLLRRHPLPAHA